MTPSVIEHAIAVMNGIAGDGFDEIEIGASVIFETIGFDAKGRSMRPLELRQPALAGTSVFLQCIDTSFLDRASNALELRLTP